MINATRDIKTMMYLRFKDRLITQHRKYWKNSTIIVCKNTMVESNVSGTIGKDRIKLKINFNVYNGVLFKNMYNL